MIPSQTTPITSQKGLIKTEKISINNNNSQTSSNTPQLCSNNNNTNNKPAVPVKPTNLLARTQSHLTQNELNSFKAKQSQLKVESKLNFKTK
jgi:hypothetical protein